VGEKARGAAVVAIYALLAVLAVPVYPHFQSPNELTRWALAASAVEARSLEVSSVLPLLNPAFEDLAVKDGTTYSNKAPGTALVALPGYLAARLVTKPLEPSALRTQLDGMRLFGATLPTVALALVVAWASVRLGGETSRVPLVLLGLLFGTPLFAYGLLLFSHALVACCLFGAWSLLFVPGSPRAVAWREVAAGALVGLAVFSEYGAVAPGMVLFVCAGIRAQPARVARVALGGLPFAVAIGLYDLACFGSPFVPSYRFEKWPEYRELIGSGFFGIHLPSASILGRFAADPSKGLLLFSPFLLLAVKGVSVAGRALSRDAAIALVLAPLSVVAVYAGYSNWHGGWTVGPRYILGGIPFLVVTLAFRRGGRLEAALLGASVLAVTTTSLAFPFVPGEFPLPWGSFAWPLLTRGLVMPNALHLLSRPLAVAAPFALVAAAVACAMPARRLPSFALGAALSLGAALALPARFDRRLAVERAYLEDVYFGRTGALEKSLHGIPVPPGLAARRAEDLTRAPGPWPF
jgi:hypothetical protein